MRIDIIGGGPAGLLVALLARRRDPARRVIVHERRARGRTHGFGITLDQDLGFLAGADPDLHAAIEAALVRWSDFTVRHRGQDATVPGTRFSGGSRAALLDALCQRCDAVGVDLRFGEHLDDPAAIQALASETDLLVGADGAQSAVRGAFADVFQPACELRLHPYAWYGIARPVDAMTLILREHERGFFVGHAYPYAPDASTLIVECDPDTFARSGLAGASDAERARLVASVFADVLDGAPLLAEGARWTRFLDVRVGRWSAAGGGDGRGDGGRGASGAGSADASGPPVVLLGDALHTTHYVLGAGTRLAFEDAIALDAALAAEATVPAALARFEAERRPIVEARQRLSRQHQTWYERARERAHHLDARGVIEDLQADQRGWSFDLEAREAAERFRAAGGHLAGHVTDIDGAPIEGAQVTFSHDPAAGPSDGAQATAWTDPTGRFALACPDAPLGRGAALAMFASGCEPLSFPVAAAPRLDGIEVRLARAAPRASLPVAIRVRFGADVRCGPDVDPAPLLVEVRATDEAGAGWTAAFVPIDPDGVARALLDLDPGRVHAVSVHAPGFASAVAGRVTSSGDGAFEASVDLARIGTDAEVGQASPPDPGPVEGAL